MFGSGGGGGGGGSSPQIVISPSSITVAVGGSPGIVTVNAVGSTGTISANLGSCAHLITLNQPGGLLPVNDSITGVASGTCQVFFSSTNGQSANLTVNVTGGSPGGGSVSGPAITLNPSSLNLSVGGSAGVVSVGASGNTGTVSANFNNCSGVVTSNQPGGSLPINDTFTPVAAGSCQVIFTSTNGQTAVLPITVSSSGGGGAVASITLNPSTLNLAVGGSAGVVTVGATGNTGTVSANFSNCSGIVTSTQPGGSLPINDTFTPVAAGSCQVSFSSTNGQTATLRITVTGGGSAGTQQVINVPSPGYYLFGNYAAGAPGVALTLTWNVGTVSVDPSNCQGYVWASVASSVAGSITYNVYPQGRQGQCTFRINGSLGTSVNFIYLGATA